MKTERLIPKKNKPTDAEIRRRKFFMLKSILPRHMSLPLDGILCAASNAFHLDLFRLEKQIPNYNGDACTYKGKPNYSMAKAVEEEWGKEARNLIEGLIWIYTKSTDHQL